MIEELDMEQPTGLEQGQIWLEGLFLVVSIAGKVAAAPGLDPGLQSSKLAAPAQLTAALTLSAIQLAPVLEPDQRMEAALADELAVADFLLQPDLVDWQLEDRQTSRLRSTNHYLHPA